LFCVGKVRGANSHLLSATPQFTAMHRRSTASLVKKNTYNKCGLKGTGIKCGVRGFEGIMGRVPISILQCTE